MLIIPSRCWFSNPNFLSVGDCFKYMSVLVSHKLADSIFCDPQTNTMVAKKTAMTTIVLWLKSSR